MGKKYILDTNAVIDYVGDKLPTVAALKMDEIANDELIISIITKIEVLGFNGDPLEMQKLTDFLSLSNTIYVDDLVANKAIELRKAYRKLKLGDAIIAATALANQFILISRNTKDFENITGLVCANPYDFT
jgi:predicted nucleic acid-binding protein